MQLTEERRLILNTARFFVVQQLLKSHETDLVLSALHMVRPHLADDILVTCPTP